MTADILPSTQIVHLGEGRGGEGMGQRGRQGGKGGGTCHYISQNCSTYQLLAMRQYEAHSRPTALTREGREGGRKGQGKGREVGRAGGLGGREGRAALLGDWVVGGGAQTRSLHITVFCPVVAVNYNTPPIITRRCIMLFRTPL